ncbi:unnamed protein product [Dovyalis caffra]|uniref:Spermine synthase n=1 Tax=Dovyalis caffra TaxID=77055 RepID=A0AAV1RID0_9ROSI|nr:unnamed protein product [Dovyalis caffra]
MTSLFSAANPLPLAPPSTPTISYSQTHQWCTCRTTNPFFFPFPYPLTYSRLTQKPNAHATLQGSSSSSDSNKEQQQQEGEEEEEYQVLTAVRSQYNDIVIVDTPKTRMLLLDSTHHVHSVLYKDGQKWTRSYWDEFATLPAIIPEGPVAIFGLGGGTAAHLMLHVWPSLQLEGWEIDEILINKARDYFGLSDLEKHTQAGGILHVVVGDALCPLEDDCRKYAGIVIDLFYGGAILPQLQEVETWLKLKDRLIPNGRFMVNCGGIEELDSINGRINPKSVDDAWVENPTIKVLCEAFPGQLSWKKKPESEGANYLALSGPLPDLTSWSAMVPDHLSATRDIQSGTWHFCEFSCTRLKRHPGICPLLASGKPLRFQEAISTHLQFSFESFFPCIHLTSICFFVECQFCSQTIITELLLKGRFDPVKFLSESEIAYALDSFLTGFVNFCLEA